MKIFLIRSSEAAVVMARSMSTVHVRVVDGGQGGGCAYLSSTVRTGLVVACEEPLSRRGCWDLASQESRGIMVSA